MKSTILALAVSLNFIPFSKAAVTYTFSEQNGAVVAAYSGQLNTSGLSFQGGLSYSDRYADILGIVTVGQSIIEIQNAQPLPVGQHPSYLGTSFRYSAENISFNLGMNFQQRRYNAPNSVGDTFGFYIFERSGSYSTWLNLPWQYISGNAISGEMRFEGESFNSMGLESFEAFTVFLPGGELIVGRVVPEPSLGILVMFALSFTLTCRTRQAISRC